MPFRQYSLRSLLVVMTAVALACGLLKMMAPYASRDYVIAYAFHMIPVVMYCLLLGTLFGNVERAIAAGVSGLLLAEVAWIGFHLLIGASFDAELALYNPLALTVLFACPVACARNRALAVILAIVFSILLPIGTCMWALSQLPTGPAVRGTGLASVMIIIATCAAVLTGVATAYLTASICTIFDGINTWTSTQPQKADVVDMHEVSD